MASYSHTLSVKKNNKSVYRSCSFKSKPSTKGDHWHVHDGFIMDSLQGKLPAVVKIPTNAKSLAAPVAAELEMLNLLESVLSCCTKVAKSVKVVATFGSVVDKVGKLCRLRGKVGGDNTRSLREGAKVLVQVKAGGDIQCLLDIGQRRQPQHPDSQDPLMTLVHESFAFSRGQCVIAGVKGFKVRDDKGRVTYHVTSLTIHSREKKYGEKDEGVEGVALYKAWSGLHHRVLPTAPPPPPEVTVSDTNADLPRKISSPPTTKEFRIHPVPESALESKATLPRNFSSQLLGANLADYEELFAKVPQLRSLLSEKSLIKLLGLPPSYSFTGA